MRPAIWILSILIVLIAAYNIWAEAGKDYTGMPSATAGIPEIITKGRDAGKGNLIAFQPYLRTSAFCDEEHFTNALAPLFKQASADSLLKSGTIVVLPENIGTWLVFANEKALVYQADSMSRGIAVIVNSNIFTFIKKLLAAKGKDRIRQALFNMKAAPMARIYQDVFSRFSKQYHITIVAGSIVLPQPSIDQEGHLAIGKGPLYNASFIFGEEGKLLSPPVKKRLLSPDEKRFLAPGQADFPIITTHAGNLLVMFPEDSQGAAALKFSATPSLIAFPSDSEMAPHDKTDWNVTGKSIRNGIQVFSSGSLWEHQQQGIIRALQNDSSIAYPVANKKSRIVNTWLQ